MSKKRGETKMPDVVRAVADVALGVAVSTAEEMNEPLKYSSHRENQPRPRSRTFTAKPCSVCAALREPDTNFTRVYATRDSVRYCKCTFCNNTWKDSDG